MLVVHIVYEHTIVRMLLIYAICNSAINPLPAFVKSDVVVNPLILQASLRRLVRSAEKTHKEAGV